MKYRGYTGSVEPQSPRGFTGRIQGIHPPIVYAGRTARKLEDAFIKAVDTYLQIGIDQFEAEEKERLEELEKRSDREEEKEIRPK